MKKLHNPDIWLIILTLIFVLIGIVFVFNSSVSIALRDFNDKYYFLREQIKWIIVGITCMGIVSRIPYYFYRKIALPLFIFTVLLLFLVFIPGMGVHAYGANRWVKIGFFVFQPSELTKLSLILYLSSWISEKKYKLIPFLSIIGVIILLVLAEPDMGTSIIILLISLNMYFISNAPILHFAVILPLILSGGAAFALSSSYRMKRIMTFLNPENDPQGASYQIRQAMLAIGSGGIFGLGIGKSRQKYEYLPEANTDSIFAILSEETGFIGALMFTFLYCFFVLHIILIGKRAPDQFSRLICFGIASWLGYQSVINIASITALMPLTGVPLPLISYGGSSLVITLIAIGIVLNISMYEQTKK